MKVLASEMVPVDFVAMMLEIVKIVIVPIGAAMLADYLEHASPRGRNIALSCAAAAACVLTIAVLGGWNYAATRLAGSVLTAVGVVGFLLGAVVAGVAYQRLRQRVPQLRATHALAGHVRHRLRHFRHRSRRA